MKRIHLVLAALAIAAVLGNTQAANAKHGSQVVVTGHAGVNVWIDGGDVFQDYDDVTIWLRAERDCYTSLFLVDTDGYLHVLTPNAWVADGWVRGGRAYCFRAGDLGLDRLYGRGIAYVFAVGSPVAFDYAPYGAGIYVGGFGFRIYGDPFVACRDFYMTLLPASCRWDYVGVASARFYVREWQRYPSYLCYGDPGFHVRVNDACGVCSHVYTSYRQHCASPVEAFRPAPRYKQTYASYKQTYDARRGQTGRLQAVGADQARRGAVARAERDVTKRSSEARVVSRPAGQSVQKASKSTGRNKQVRVVSTSRTRESEHSRAIAPSPARAERPERAAEVRGQAMTKQARSEKSVVAERQAGKSMTKQARPEKSVVAQRGAGKGNARAEKGAGKKSRQAE